ncbi:ATP-binding protein [Catellatospora tritici]|uniref:ATP-binding protein n=1 Tax=Catellatospora tritici TaxID=2851566 RepID=UPI001C2DA2A7|nr:ATP-binding protein [Catellatospora tritici]MBV1849360.1 ATP-binding protein [Catellatospora tritici]
MTQGGDEDFSDRLDLTPSPRLLQVLGDLPYQPWQCLAELIDNAFDDFLSDQERDPMDSPAVQVTLPRQSTAEGDEIVCVADNGRGMTARQLGESLKAGYSAKSRHGSLGLFGMGFNIATARLGNVTEVRTTRAGDSTWLIAEIDFRKMQRQGGFEIPLRREPKQDVSLHGTEVTVRTLRAEARDRLRRPSTASQIRDRLGKVYSYMLRSADQVRELPGPMLAGRGFALYVNGTRVKPHLPCVWSPARSVSNRGRLIPAVIEINKPLKAAWACMSCGHWHVTQLDNCVECGGNELQLRERRIAGWVGVQRYFDTSDFGIDLLRNGRKILIADKTLFDWEHPDTGEIWKEYPIELGSTVGGRLVGEVHLDHVPVVYQKNDFERSTTEFISAVQVIRGEGPLQPRKARSVGFGDNTSYLGQLFSGYRDIDPGLKCLVPGDGKKAVFSAAKEWASRFHKGQAEYLTDEKWFEQAAEHDRIKRGESRPTGPGTVRGGATGTVDGDGGRRRSDIPETPDPNGDDDLFTRTGLGDIFGRPGGRTAPADNPPPPPETEEQRFERYLKAARVMHDLTGEVSLASLTRREVVAYETTERLIDASGIDTPCLSRSGRANKIDIFVNGDHEVFREYGRDPREYAIVQLAEHLRTAGRLESTIATVAADVTKALPDQRLTDTALRARISSVLGRIRELLTSVAVEHSTAIWSCLPNSEKIAAEHTALADEPRLVWPDLTTDGRFVAYLGAGGVAAIVRERPDLVLDGRVFVTTWATWTSEDAKERQVSRLSRHLEAIGEFMSSTDAKSRLDRAMARLTLDMLDQETSGGELT